MLNCLREGDKQKHSFWQIAKQAKEFVQIIIVVQTTFYVGLQFIQF